MAKRGEIDPWNIDVVDITDRFLKKLEEARSLDLRISGRVLLYAAILVRMKAEAITMESIGGDYEEEEEFQPYILDDVVVSEDDFDSVRYAEEVLRSHKKRVRKISTLGDLIKELRKAEEVEKRRRKKKRERGEITVEPLKVPHEEDLEETISRVEEELRSVFKRKNYTTLFTLSKDKDVGKLVDYYVSILHLAFRRRIEMEQDEMYGDVKIFPLNIESS